MSADWSRLSSPIMRALLSLDFAVPTHQTMLVRAGVRGPTVEAAVRLELVRRAWLFEEGSTAPMPFFTLTQRGQNYVRDYHAWHDQVNKAAAEIVGCRLSNVHTPEKGSFQ